METRFFYTTGKRDIIEETWDKPDPNEREIEVKSVFTGVCRSDIDMYTGIFQTLPKYIQGHEGVGIVTKVAKKLKHIQEGDYVATRGEPAFSDFYNCPEYMYVKIPRLDPSYIIEPVACGLNISRSIHIDTPADILILGTGFLAKVIYTSLSRYYSNNIIVVGHANPNFWKTAKNVTVVDKLQLVGKKFKYIFDISDKPEYMQMRLYEERAEVVVAAEKHPAIITSFSEFLWNSVNIHFPSPRNVGFYNDMVLGVKFIEEDILDVDDLWTKSYDRNTEVKLAFEEGVSRPKGYSRGYIKW